MGIARAQSKSLGTTSATGNSIAVTLNSAVALGSRILVYGEWGSAPASTAITGVTDTLNTTTGWAEVAGSFIPDSFGPNSGDIWENKNSVGGAAPTVTVNLSSALGFRAIIVHVLTGADPAFAADKVAGATKSGNTAFVSPAVIPTISNEYICGFCLQDTDNTHLPTANSPFTLVEDTGDGATLQIAASEDFIQGAAASIASSFQFSVLETGAVSVVTIRPLVDTIAIPFPPQFPNKLPLNRLIQSMISKLHFTQTNPPPPPSGSTIIQRRTLGIMNKIGSRRAK